MSRILAALAAAVFALALICFPQAGAEAARTGLALCGETILPALFPYFVLSNLIIYSGLADRLSRILKPVMSPLFHVGGAGGTALALGLAGGYPTGAATVRTLLDEGTCTPEEAQSLLLFCNNSGPAFILAVAGAAVFGRMSLGFFLLAVHIAGALGTGLLLRRPARALRARPPRADKASPPAGTLLTASVQKALNASLQVCAYVVLFNVLIGLLRQIFPALSALPAPVSALGMGLLELSSGVCGLTGAGATPLSLAVCAFLLGWGGLSVHCQTAALLEGSGLRLAPYLGAKALHGAISAGLSLACTACFPRLVSAASGGQLSLTRLFPVSVPLGWVLWAVVACFLIKRGGKPARDGVQ